VSFSVRTTSVDDTRQVAAAVARVLRPRDLVVLSGEMGAGKTAFTQGLAAELGVVGPVTSPTFTLVHNYEGRIPLHHVDIYRLERLAEVADLGLSELLDGDGAVIIEWGDVIDEVLPAEGLDVMLDVGPGPDDRRITFESRGGSWTVRLTSLERAMEPWRC
jgi:tRNA threonylcarbamoyladenosine biosynthesis protein TsaE